MRGRCSNRFLGEFGPFFPEPEVVGNSDLSDSPAQTEEFQPVATEMIRRKTSTLDVTCHTLLVLALGS